MHVYRRPLPLFKCFSYSTGSLVSTAVLVHQLYYIFFGLIATLSGKRAFISAFFKNKDQWVCVHIVIVDMYTTVRSTYSQSTTDTKQTKLRSTTLSFYLSVHLTNTRPPPYLHITHHVRKHSVRIPASSDWAAPKQVVHQVSSSARRRDPDPDPDPDRDLRTCCFSRQQTATGLGL